MHSSPKHGWHVHRPTESFANLHYDDMALLAEMSLDLVFDLEITDEESQPLRDFHQLVKD